MGVEDHDHEGRSWDVLSAPLDLDAVVAGLEVGELVVTDGAAWLGDGHAVRVVADAG